VISIKLILMIFAFICLLLTAFNISAPRVHLGWLGLACWLLSVLIA
jgi:hypothetical protein